MKKILRDISILTFATMPMWLVVLAFLLPAKAVAADLTIVAPGCSSWSLAGSTLTCASTGTAPAPTPTPPPVPTPPPIPTSIHCAGFATTQVLDASWPASNVTRRSLSSGFGNGVALVVRFTTGFKAGFGRLTVAEWGSAPTFKTSALSQRPCDWSPQASPYANAVGVTVGSNFSVGQNSFGYPELNANTTYYLNLKNEVNGMASCADSCDVFIDLKAP
jgi:hypothetical protein